SVKTYHIYREAGEYTITAFVTDYFGYVNTVNYGTVYVSERIWAQETQTGDDTEMIVENDDIINDTATEPLNPELAFSESVSNIYVSESDGSTAASVLLSTCTANEPDYRYLDFMATRTPTIAEIDLFENSQKYPIRTDSTDETPVAHDAVFKTWYEDEEKDEVENDFDWLFDSNPLGTKLGTSV
ncbi:MAG: hypothetical protein ACRC2T_20610, partial [Thermoguttaceae bacterium]